MSPSPDRVPNTPQAPLPDETNPLDKQPSASDPSLSDAVLAEEAALDQSSDPGANGTPVTDATVEEVTPLVPKRPLMRPVNRPQPPPAQPPAAQKPAAAVVPPKPEAASVETVATATVEEPASTSDQTLIRQQPIPPPSEPKQYRAIGLVRGRYTPSEEQFTRGAMITSDGTEVEAVLLGRVMSLVRNHLDLEQEHLWVVYPRTREMRQDLHVQIVGVWEPERLNKTEDAESDVSSESVLDSDEILGNVADADVPEALPDASPEAVAVPEVTSIAASDESDLDENYFSIRGEVVFYSADDQQIVVKIQQAPRKTADREKAFKLRLDGVLSSPKALGYFWDLQVERRSAALVVTSGTAIGLVPPKKKTASSGSFNRSGDRRPPQRRTRPASSGVRSAGPIGAPRREPVPKPVKRTEQASDG